MTKLFHECPDCQRREEAYTVLFRMRNYNDNTKGEMYSDTEDTWVNVSAHETESDLIDTIIHESIHVALKREEISDDREHNLIKHMNWVAQDWLL
jgi:hypothetical protein